MNLLANFIPSFVLKMLKDYFVSFLSVHPTRFLYVIIDLKIKHEKKGETLTFWLKRILYKEKLMKTFFSTHQVLVKIFTDMRG